MKTKFVLLLILLGLSLVVCQEEQTQQEDKKQQQEEEQPQHFIFRADQAGLEIVQQQFIHTFAIFYQGKDIPQETEQKLEDFIRNNYSDQNMYIALDAKANGSLVEKFEIKIESEEKTYVALVRNGVTINFSGNLEENWEGFLEWFKEWTVPKIYHLETKEDLDTLIQTYEENSVIYYKGKKDTGFELIKHYINQDLFLQNNVHKVYYYDVPEEDTDSSLVLLKVSPYQEEKVLLYTEKVQEQDSLTDFLRIGTLQAVNKLTQESYISIFGSSVSTQALLFLTKDQEINQKFIKEFEEAAIYNVSQQLHYQRAVFTLVERIDEYEELFDLFMLQNEKEPKLIVSKTNYSNFQFEKFRFNYEEYNKDNIVAFVEDVQLKKVDPFYQTEDTPVYKEDPEGTEIRNIVGQNFKQEVILQTVNYLILFWDSKDPMSAVKYEKLLTEFIENFGDRMKGVLRIGKFDLHKNENLYVNLESAPQLVMYPQQEKRRAIKFDSQLLSLEMLKVFLRQWTANINLEEKKDPLPLAGGKTDL